MNGTAMECIIAGVMCPVFECSAEERMPAAEVTTESGKTLGAYDSWNRDSVFHARGSGKRSGDAIARWVDESVTVKK